LGLALNIKINEIDHVVPMVVEEPSVIAAVSGAGKLIAANGGFTATGPTKNIVLSQIQLLDVLDAELQSSLLAV
jgi:hydroxymethylglutaryl-CoA reductase